MVEQYNFTLKSLGQMQSRMEGDERMQVRDVRHAQMDGLVD